MAFWRLTLLLAAFVFTVIFFLPLGGEGAANAATFSCRVTGVHDGDGPIYCASGEKIRLTAVAARELDGTCSSGHPCPEATAEAAKAQLESLVLGQTLRCEQTGTSYQRITAWCWREDGIEINCAMVRSETSSYWRRYDPAGRLCESGEG